MTVWLWPSRVKVTSVVPFGVDERTAAIRASALSTGWSPMLVITSPASQSGGLAHRRLR